MPVWFDEVGRSVQRLAQRFATRIQQSSAVIDVGQPDQLSIKIDRRARWQTAGHSDLCPGFAFRKQIATRGEQSFNFTFRHRSTRLEYLRDAAVSRNELEVRTRFTLRADHGQRNSKLSQTRFTLLARSATKKPDPHHVHAQRLRHHRHVSGLPTRKRLRRQDTINFADCDVLQSQPTVNGGICTDADEHNRPPAVWISDYDFSFSFSADSRASMFLMSLAPLMAT